MQPDAPWRALEEPDEPGVDAVPATSVGGRSPRTVAVVAAGIGALGLILVVVAAFVLVGSSAAPPVVVDSRVDAAATAATGASRGTPAASTAGAQVVIDVGGAVARPGLYRLPAGSRVGDAIAAAGGFGPRVDAEAAGRLNLAAKIVDGSQVWVPSRDDGGTSGGPTANGPSSTPAAAAASARGAIDLNTASAEELDTLPGIGPATAARIIASRTERPFASVDDLKTRKLVSSTTFSKLAGLITVGP